MIRLRNLLVAVAASTLAGCASFDGYSLVPGKSTAAEVEATMGKPFERIPAAGGGSVWYYPRYRQTFAARVGADGVLLSIDPLLVEPNIRRIAPGVTTAAQAREILGPPLLVARNTRLERDIWEYNMQNEQQWDYFLEVQFSYDGIVREVMMLKDYSKEMGDSGLP